LETSLARQKGKINVANTRYICKSASRGNFSGSERREKERERKSIRNF
jgi:hypothetical protein